MRRLPADEIRHLSSFVKRSEDISVETARQWKKALALEFRKQLEQGHPNKRNSE